MRGNKIEFTESINNHYIKSFTLTKIHTCMHCTISGTLYIPARIVTISFYFSFIDDLCLANNLYTGHVIYFSTQSIMLSSNVICVVTLCTLTFSIHGSACAVTPIRIITSHSSFHALLLYLTHAAHIAITYHYSRSLYCHSDTPHCNLQFQRTAQSY